MRDVDNVFAEPPSPTYDIIQTQSVYPLLSTNSKEHSKESQIPVPSHSKPTDSQEIDIIVPEKPTILSGAPSSHSLFHRRAPEEIVRFKPESTGENNQSDNNVHEIVYLQPNTVQVSYRINLTPFKYHKMVFGR